MLVVAPPVTEAFQEHMALCLALRIPFFFVITKTDLGFYDSQETMAQLQKAMRNQGCLKNLILFENDKDEVPINDAGIVPVFMVSCVTGEGLDGLTNFIRNLVPVESTPADSDPDSCLFQIDETFRYAEQIDDVK